MPTPLRCVFYDPGAVDAGSRLSERAFEACERADVAVFTATDELEVAELMREHGVTPEQAIVIGAGLRDAPVGGVWVRPLDIEVRGPTVRVAEEGDELLYEAVIAELATRRAGP
jgi:hypothetical protein